MSRRVTYDEINAERKRKGIGVEMTQRTHPEITTRIYKNAVMDRMVKLNTTYYNTWTGKPMKWGIIRSFDRKAGVYICEMTGSKPGAMAMFNWDSIRNWIRDGLLIEGQTAR